MTAAVPPKTSVHLGTKLSYGIGSVAFGIKDNGFNYFLLLFYSQVIGLDPRLVGLALTLALVVDALSDPIVGYWSDNLQSRWGRRHPFMYASAIPVAASYFLLWNPPSGWSQQNLFWYLLLLAIFVRFWITVYETPSAALAPELAADYDARTSLLSWRYFFGWSGGNAMSVLMFLALFPAFATATIANGQFNREAYALYGVISSVLILLAILISAFGTQARVANLRLAPPRRKLGVRKIFGEIFETLANRSFVSLFAAAIFGAVATGLSSALAFYFGTYFWGFTPIQLGFVTLSVFASAAIGSAIAPIATKRLGKKRGAIIIGLIAFLGSPLPLVLRLMGLLPDNGTPFVFWFVLITNMVDTGLIICFQILTASMIADLVEDSELTTGRRSEGLFFSATTFIRKAVQGLGLLAASVVLTFAQFPVGAAQGEVGADALWRLGAFYVPSVLALWLIMIAAISTYRLTRGQHEANLEELARSSADRAEPRDRLPTSPTI